MIKFVHWNRIPVTLNELIFVWRNDSHVGQVRKQLMDVVCDAPRRMVVDDVGNSRTGEAPARRRGRCGTWQEGAVVAFALFKKLTTRLDHLAELIPED